MRPALVAIAVGCALAGPAFAQDTRLQVVIELPGNAERNVVSYQCEGVETPLSVDYVNADPLFIAFVPIDGAPRLFVNVVSADGARYASGPYEWWTRGPDATLTDLTADPDAETPSAPLACAEVTETP